MPIRRCLCVLTVGLVTGCAVGPAYQVPSSARADTFKEAQGWSPAAPADTLERGPWWTLFGDSVLNKLADSVEVTNQNVAASVAAYEQARALVAQQRAALFPVVTLDASANRAGTRNVGADNVYRLNLGATWEPDVWGRLRSGVTAAQANEQASAADLAAARLSAQGELAANYFSLRQTDAQRELVARTVDGYVRSLQIAQNRYNAGIAPHSDVLQAITQLANARTDGLTLDRQRAQFEHAIAILVGQAPSAFALPTLPWQVTIPQIPTGVPSTLLQRRPDIAAAERRVEAANAGIGIARSAYFPDIGLTASYGTLSSALPDLLHASSTLWAVGLSAAQTVFNAGATDASVAFARAQHEEAVARYRQTVLTAFADVEDQLAATHVLGQQQDLRRQASEAADQVEAQMVNRYKAGQVSYTDVVTAQVTALNARRALVQVQADRQTTAVALIQSLGGGWHAP